MIVFAVGILIGYAWGKAKYKVFKKDKDDEEDEGLTYY